jgi:hypothetical protein
MLYSISVSIHIFIGKSIGWFLVNIEKCKSYSELGLPKLRRNEVCSDFYFVLFRSY